MNDEELKKALREQQELLRKIEEAQRKQDQQAIRKGDLCPHGRIWGDCRECDAGR